MIENVNINFLTIETEFGKLILKFKGVACAAECRVICLRQYGKYGISRV